jgi:hypothetical protein
MTDNTGHTSTINEAVNAAIADDSEWVDTDYIIRKYDAGNPTVRDAIDAAFICLTGWSLTTYIRRAKGEAA